jgi:hypothetical protein
MRTASATRLSGQEAARDERFDAGSMNGTAEAWRHDISRTSAGWGAARSSWVRCRTGRVGAAERTGFLHRSLLNSDRQIDSCTGGGVLNSATGDVDIQRLCPYFGGCGSGDPPWEEFFSPSGSAVLGRSGVACRRHGVRHAVRLGCPLSDLGVLGSSAGVPAFATLNSDRAVEILERDGRLQAFAVDLATGRRRMATSAPDGVDLCELEPDGRHLWWFDHGTGQWARQPFEGGPDRPALTGVPGGRMYGIAFDHNGSTAAVSVAGGSRCYAGRPGERGTVVAGADGYLGLIDMAPAGHFVAMAGRPDGPNAVCLCPIGAGEQVMLAGTSETACDPGCQCGKDLQMFAQGGGVVLAAWAHVGCPQWPAVGSGDDLYVPAVVGVLA